jgi:hypothetical protein
MNLSGDSPRGKWGPTIDSGLSLSDKDPAPSLPELVEMWRKRLTDAEIAFREADQALRTAQEKKAAGSPEIAAARERKSKARLEYRRILRTFSDLVLRGKRPR